MEMKDRFKEKSKKHIKVDSGTLNSIMESTKSKASKLITILESVVKKTN